MDIAETVINNAFIEELETALFVSISTFRIYHVR